MRLKPVSIKHCALIPTKAKRAGTASMTHTTPFSLTKIRLTTDNQHFLSSFTYTDTTQVLNPLPKLRQLQVIKWTLLFYSLCVAYQNITSVYGKHMGSNDTHCTLDSIVVVTPTDLAGIWLVFWIVAESHQWEKTYLLVAVHSSLTCNVLLSVKVRKRSTNKVHSDELFASPSFWGIPSCYVSTSSFVASWLVPIALARYLLGLLRSCVNFLEASVCH